MQKEMSAASVPVLPPPPPASNKDAPLVEPAAGNNQYSKPDHTTSGGGTGSQHGRPEHGTISASVNQHSRPDAGANNSSKHCKSPSLGKMSHYLSEMKKEVDQATKQRR